MYIQAGVAVYWMILTEWISMCICTEIYGSVLFLHQASERTNPEYLEYDDRLAACLRYPMQPMIPVKTNRNCDVASPCYRKCRISL